MWLPSKQILASADVAHVKIAPQPLMTCESTSITAVLHRGGEVVGRIALTPICARDAAGEHGVGGAGLVAGWVWLACASNDAKVPSRFVSGLK